MISPMLLRLLLFVFLPVVSWSGRVAIGSVPGTGTLDPETLAAFPSAAANWSNIPYDDVTIRFSGGMKPLSAITLATTVRRVIAEDDPGARGRLIAGSNIDCASDPQPGLRLATVPATYDIAGMTAIEIGRTHALPGGVDELVRYPLPKSELLPYASNAYLIETLDLSRNSGMSTSAAAMDFNADRRSKSLSLDRGATYVQVADGNNSSAAQKVSKWEDGLGMETMKPGAPAGQWLRISPRQSDTSVMDAVGWNRPMGEPVALFLIGLLWIMPSILRCRGEVGEQRSGHRRRSGPRRDAIPASPQRQARDRADQESEEDADQDESPKEEFPVASLHE